MKKKTEEQFIKNKYNNWYFKIIDNALSQERVKGDDNYYEKHHIIPRSIGGNDSKENLVLLTAREHYICHWLLIKFTFGINKSKMVYAFNQMNICENEHSFGKRYRNSYAYEFFKKEYSLIHSETMSNRIITKETKIKLSKSKTGNKNPNFGKHLTEQQKRKISVAVSGEKHPMYGKFHTEASRIKMKKNGGKCIGEKNGMYKCLNLENVIKEVKNNNIKTLKQLELIFDMSRVSITYKLQEFGYKGFKDFRQKVLNGKD